MSEYSFSAEDARHAGVETSWVDELLPGGKFAGFSFVSDAGRVTATVQIDVEDEQGLVRRLNADWDDEESVKRATLQELIAATRVRALAGQLAIVRGDQGIHQAQLAAQIGLPEASGAVQISRWETNQRSPSLQVLIQWGEALGLELAWQRK